MPFTRQPYPDREPNPTSFPVGSEAELPGKVAKREDQTIRRDIESALFYDNMVNSYQVTVDVVDGVVTLSGAVDSEDERRMAEEDARVIPGVRQIVNNLTVRS